MSGGRVAALYIAWALPLLLALVWIVPPWTNTDEPFHMLRGVSLAHGHIIGTRFDNPDKTGPKGSGGLSDPAIFDAFGGLAKLSWLPGQRDGQVSAAMLAKSDAATWHRDLALVWFGTTAQYPPFFYLPDMAGYWIGRAAGLRVNATLRLARCLNALLFLAGAAAAIARARRLRPILTVILMLPMVLALAASANQDAGMIAAMALIVAQFDRIADAKSTATPREAAWIAAGLACIAMARPPYIALLVLVPAAAPGRAGRLAAALGGASVLAWCALVAMFVMRPLSHAEPASQFAGLLAHPASLFLIVANTIRFSFLTYAWEFIGLLGWNDVPLPLAYLVLAYATLALAAGASMPGPAFARGRVLASSLCVAVGIFALLYLDWTPPGADHVEGVSGRHFLPLALVCALALPHWRRRLVAPAKAAILCFALVTPAVMLHHIVLHYYVRVG